MIFLNILGTLGYNKFIDSSNEVGQYIKQSKGDYTPLSDNEIRAILMQMQRNQLKL